MYITQHSFSAKSSFQIWINDQKTFHVLDTFSSAMAVRQFTRMVTAGSRFVHGIPGGFAS
jgi:hypothetical protein